MLIVLIYHKNLVKGICAVQLLTSDGTPGNVLFLGGNQGGSQGSADHVSRKKVEMLDINTNTITDHSVMNFGHSLSACTVFFRYHSYITSSHFWDFWTPLPPYVSMFLVLRISKNWHFLTPLPPYKC